MNPSNWRRLQRRKREREARAIVLASLPVAFDCPEWAIEGATVDLLAFVNPDTLTVALTLDFWLAKVKRERIRIARIAMASARRKVKRKACKPGQARARRIAGKSPVKGDKALAIAKAQWDLSLARKGLLTDKERDLMR